MKWRKQLSGIMAFVMVASSFAAAAPIKAEAETSVYSVNAPTEDLQIDFWLDENGTPWYQVVRNDVEILEDGKLGLTTSLGELKSGLSIKGTPVESSGDSTWEPIVGEQSQIRDRYQETSFTLTQEETGLEFGIVMRAYDEGVAFQYVLPQLPEGTDSYTVTDEATQFVFPAGTKASLHVSTNQTVPNKYSVENFPSVAIRRPATFEYTDGQAMTICEGNLDNYSTMVMGKSGIARALEGNYTGTVTVDTEDGPVATPWRVFVTGDGATELLENSTIVQNLNDPADEATYKFSEWLEPGTCVRATRGLNNDAIKTVIDLASAHGIRYVLLDSGWYGPEYDKNADPRLDPAALDPTNPQDAILLEKYFATEGGYNNTGEGVFNTNGVGFNQYGSLGDGGSTQINVDIPALCAYGKEKNVGLVLYVNGVFFPDSSGRNRFTADELFAYYEKWGVAGVKPGFVKYGNQQHEQHMEEVIAAAAKHKLVLTIHDEYVPAGLERTYPNLMMTEGILGDEGIGKNTPQAAEDITAIFTRNVQGPSDHTFSYPGKATKAYALASPILFRSGMSVLYWYTDPGKVPAQDVGKMDIWDNMPTTWEESLFLEGSLYEYATTARRSADDVWYVGSLSAITRRLELPLDFLDEGVTYVADVYADGIDADPYAGWTTSATSAKGIQTLDYRQYLVTSEDVLERDLEYGFGYAVVLAKATEEDLAAYSPYNAYRQELELEILRAEEVTESDYTVESWELFKAAKTEAEAVAAKADAADTELENATAKLKDAREALVSTGALEAVIAGTAYYTSYHFTEESYQALVAAVADAEALLDGGVFTQAQLDAAQAVIEEAVDGLKEDPNRRLKSTVYLDELSYDADRSYAHGGAIKKKTDYYGSTLSLMVDGKEQIFERGMLTHAQSELYYNIEGKGYEIFEAYVGVDTIKATQGNIIFRVYGDGVLLYESAASGNGSQNAQYFSIPIAGVKELHLEANMNGTNDGDHAVWGDAKFLTYRNPNAYLSGILADGVPVGNFDPDCYTYFVKAENGNIPTVDVTVEEDDFTYEIIPAEKVPGYTSVVVNKRDGSTMTYRLYMLEAESGEYLSDLSSLVTKNTLYGFTKDTAQGGLQLALTAEDGTSMVTFNKGIGTHATTNGDSMVVYDISGKDYDLFEGWVGISYLKNDNRSKINFKIYVDDETTPRFESGAMTYRAPAIHYSVDVRDAKTLTLVADPCGDQSADHGCWCDAKFLNYTGVQQVSGTVDIGKTGLELSGIEVNLYEIKGTAASEEAVETTFTDENGNYIFENVIAGNYLVGIKAGENHFETMEEIQVVKEPVIQNLKLQAPEYAINISQPEDAIVTVNKSTAARDEEVIVYVKNLIEGKVVKEIQAVAEDGTSVEVAAMEGKTDCYQFVMPKQKVTVSAVVIDDAVYGEALAKAQAMDEKISSIGEVILEKKALIEEIRGEYDALPEAVKALTEKLALLEHSEYLLAQLEVQQEIKETQEVVNAAQASAEAAKQDAEAAKAAAEHAEAEAESAQAEAEKAKAEAQAAQEAAKAAQEKAEEAKINAEAAAQSAANDKTAAQAAKAEAESAQAEAVEAKAAAQTAQEKAEKAETAAKQAQEEAKEAQTNAESAKTAAETAKVKAEEAKAAAEESNRQAAEKAAQAAEESAKAATEAAKAAEESAKATEASAKASAEAVKAAEESAKAAQAATNAASSAAKAAQAQAKAQEAQAKAEEAQAKAEEEAAKAKAEKEAAEKAKAEAEAAKEAAEKAKAEAEAAKEAAEKAKAEAEAAKAAAELANLKQEAIMEVTIFAGRIDTKEMSPLQIAAVDEAIDAAMEEIDGALDAEALADIISSLKEETDKIQSVVSVKSFEDVNSKDWFYDVVDYVSFHGIMTGSDETHFKPMESLTRAQFAMILYRMEGSPAVETEKTFQDVAEGKWYEDAVLWAAEKGIVTGYEETGTFAPLNPVTREQMVVMMHRYASYLGKEVTAEGEMNSFEDAQSVGGYAKEAMQWAVGTGIISGKNGTHLDPKGTTTRGAAAAVVQRFLEAYK